MANRRRGTLYIGVTSDLPGRAWSHSQALVAGFTEKYGAKRLVYYEVHETMLSAIEREKQLKKWRRMWKIQLIETTNSEWRDLTGEL